MYCILPIIGDYISNHHASFEICKYHPSAYKNQSSKLLIMKKRHCARANVMRGSLERDNRRYDKIESFCAK